MYEKTNEELSIGINAYSGFTKTEKELLVEALEELGVMGLLWKAEELLLDFDLELFND